MTTPPDIDAIVERAVLAESNWQPIETAPKDGTKILASSAGCKWPEVIFYERYDDETAEEMGEPGFWRYADDVFADICMIEEGEFSHWMPLPSPPTPSSPSEQGAA